MIGPWILAESQRLTAALGKGAAQGPKLPVTAFWVFVPLWLILAFFGWIAARARPDLQYGIELLLLFGVLAGGCFVLQREYRPSAQQLGLQIDVWKSPAVRRWVLCAIGISVILHAIPVLLFHYHALGVTGREHALLDEARKNLVTFLFLGVFLVPAAEELTFRGYVYLILRQNWVDTVASLIPSVIFALLHGGGVPAYFCLSLLYIYINNRAQSLWPSVLAHVTYNAALLISPV